MCATSGILDEDVLEVPPIAPEAPDLPEAPISPVTTVATAAPAATTGAAVAAATPDRTLNFFMHDILGGSNPTARAVTSIVTNPGVNGQVPFAKPNGAVLPVNNGVPLNNANGGVINNNNVPFLSDLGGTTPNLIQSNGNNNFINGGFGFPVLNGVQFPSGSALQKLMFGTMTAFDEELTEGRVRVWPDSLSFFGVHRTAVSESHVAIMGGTGKYVNAMGHATVKTFPAAANQHNTDGVETLLQMYLTC
ncbi:Dirigent protein [Actinidia chinensis var. chinensis]|uniref:Dirigent protein n=1 Tax=Actinidia chinensis var. chinensis TaxID=1590841 RepID=A0A2R6PQ63_ACTCC|nr:Dirigent protein [Actinidia chinensis var. chinensis]